MKKRIKDLAYTLKLPVEFVNGYVDGLTRNEKKFYREWDKPKKDKAKQPVIKDGLLQYRRITAPCYGLKLIQRRILRNALYKLEIPLYIYGGVPAKDAVLNARYHQGNKYFFQTDFKDFYPSITYLEVQNVLRKHGFYPDVARVITRISTYSGVLPQGCPTSPFLAALVVIDRLGFNPKLISHQNFVYKISLYVDDLTISSSVDFKNKVQLILNDLRNKGFRINFDKTTYSSWNPNVTGVIVKNNGICAVPISFEMAEDFSKPEKSRIGHQRRIDYIKRVAGQNNI